MANLEFALGWGRDSATGSVWRCGQ